jgi:hypothetical protein
MKKGLIVTLLLLPAILLAKPVIKFKSTSVDFGEANAGKIMDVFFEFENAGSDILYIKNIIPSCGCTTADLKKKEYNPGEKGTIGAKFNTSGYNGRIVKTITVLTNDPESPEVRLSLSGTVIVKDFAQADLKPDHIAFGNVAAGKTVVRKLNLSNVGSQELRVIEVSMGPEVVLEFKANALPPKNSTEFTLRFTPFDKGTYNSIVKIRTNDYRNPYVFIRLEAQVD